MRLSILLKIRIIVVASAIAIVSVTVLSFVNLRGAEAASDATFNAGTENTNLLFGLLQATNFISQTVEEMTNEREPVRLGELKDKLALKEMDAARQLESLAEDGKALAEIYTSFDAEAQAVVALVNGGKGDDARLYYLDRVTPLAFNFFNRIVQIQISQNVKLMDLSRSEAESYRKANYLLGAIMLAFVILLILVGILVSSNISKSINRVVLRLKDISEGEGDLTKRLESVGRDEITDLTNHFNAFTEKLTSLVLVMQASMRNLSGTAIDLATNTEQTASAVNEISASVESLKARSDEQGVSIDATSASMTMLADGLGGLDEMISGQSDIVVHSSGAVDQMVANVQSVRNSVTELAGAFRELVSSADIGKERIDGVSSLIATIAERSTALAETNTLIASIAARTNLLSMNAAIEAAHAGDAGRGFSVVASEIRLLAENSSRQSKATATELKGIRSYIAQVVNSVNEADRSFEAILSMIDRINGLVGQIQSAMEEQGTGNSEVLGAIARINEITSAVRERSARMRRESDDALRKIAGTRRQSEEFRAGMDEIALGTGEINRAIEGIRELGFLNKRSIEEARSVTGKFKVQAEA